MVTGKSYVFAKHPLTNKWVFWKGSLLVGTVRPRLPVDGHINKNKYSQIDVDREFYKCFTGFRFDIVNGTLFFPRKKWYDPRSWLNTTTYSAYNSGNHWKVIGPKEVKNRPFLSMLFGEWFNKKYNPGAWFGWRTASLKNKVDWQLRIDWDKNEYDREAWAWNEDGSPKEAWPVGDMKGKDVVELTLSIRKDMRH